MDSTQYQLLQQVREIAKQPGNHVCAECPTRKVEYTSILKPMNALKQSVGVFVCANCYRHHFRMGMQVCETKYIGEGNEEGWTQREISILRKTGNEYVNSFLEGNLDGEDTFQNDKEIITFDKKEEDKLRCAFVKNKYIKKKYFCQDTYDRVAGSSGSSSANNSKGAKSKYSTKGKVAFDDEDDSSSSLQLPQGLQTKANNTQPQNEEAPSLRSLMGLQSRSQATTSNRSLQQNPKQRRASIAAPSATPKKGSGIGLDTFLSLQEKVDSQKRRCKSVMGTVDTTGQPQLESEKVYGSTVDVSMDELKALKAAKKAKKRESRRTSTSHMGSQSERVRSPQLQRKLTRNNSPRGVGEELSQSLQETGGWDDESERNLKLESALSSSRNDRHQQRRQQQHSDNLNDSDHAVIPDIVFDTTDTDDMNQSQQQQQRKPERRRRKDMVAAAAASKAGDTAKPERRRRRDSRLPANKPRRISTTTS